MGNILSLVLVPYGDNSNVGNSEFFLHIDPKIKETGTPDFKLSNCKYKIKRKE